MISTREWLLVGCAAAGALADVTVTRHGPAVFVASVVVGLLFEWLARPLWTFHPQLLASRFTVRGVNLFVGLGWAGVLSLGLAGSAVLQRAGLPEVVAVALAVGVCGNLVESLFFRAGVLRYRLEHPLLAFPFQRAPVLLDVPVSIRFGYFTSMAVLAAGLSRLG